MPVSSLPITAPYEFTSRGDRFGWVEGIDGKHHLTLFIENGRLLDFPGKPLKTGMLADRQRCIRGTSALTANQNLIIAGVPAGRRPASRPWRASTVCWMTP